MATEHRGMIIDGVAASEAIDSSGEQMDISGADISDLKEGRGVLNYEHKKDSDPGASANDVVGHITFAKKIYNEKDCDNDRERKYWKEVGLPFIYIKCELYDGEGHPGAIAAAALIRYYNRRKIPIMGRFSIEGSTLERDASNRNKLTKTVARRVALTLKPCNRSCLSGVVSDPKDDGEKSPEAVKDVLEAMLTQKHESPDRQTVGSYESETYDLIVEDPGNSENAREEALEDDQLGKAITAGGYDASPGSLTGGSALQVEDPSLRRNWLKSQLRAAVRDWDGKTGTFRDFLKFRLPEVDDGYLDHFTNLVEDLHLKKAQKLQDKVEAAFSLDKKEKPQRKPKMLPSKDPNSGEALLDEKGKPVPSKRPVPTQKPIKKPAAGTDFAFGANAKPSKEIPPSLTHRGVGGKLNPVISGPGQASIDENLGVLHNARGALFINIPKRDPHFHGQPLLGPTGQPLISEAGVPLRQKDSHEEFLKALHSPDVKGPWEEAMSHWLRLHNIARQGKIPDEVIAHSALFSILSPNTPVYMQEWMYSHMLDTIKHTGLVPWKPGFDLARHDFMGRNQPTGLPETHRDYWAQRAPRDIVMPNDSAYQSDRGQEPRKAGENASFMLADDKFDNVEKYHLLHNYLTHLVRKHTGPEGIDARKAVRELMDAKKSYKEYKAKAQRADENGRDVEAFSENHRGAPGLAIKTGLYSMLMLGAGNSVVPDTHFIRHTFGLHGDKDPETVKYVKNTLWNIGNMDLMDSINRYYVKHHPAYAEVVKHPMFRGVHPSQMVGPAFWWHWIAIPKHEQALGTYAGQAENEGTDHYPYFKQIDDILTKHLGDKASLFKSLDRPMEYDPATNELLSKRPVPFRTAMAMQEIVSRFGEAAAQWTYFKHLLPLLLEEAQQNLNKSDDLLANLVKAVVPAEAAPKPMLPALQQQETPGSHMFRGKKVMPGRADIIAGPLEGQSLPLLGHDDNHAYVISGDNAVYKLPKMMESKVYRVGSEAKTLPNQAQVDASVPNEHDWTPNQTALAHGLDLNGVALQHSAMGKFAMVRPSMDEVHRKLYKEPDQAGFSEATRASAAHAVAAALGLGDHYQAAISVKHPHTGQEFLAKEMMAGSNNTGAPGDEQDELLRQGDAGNLHRLAMADFITGNQDRPPYDYVLTPGEGAGVHLTNNGLSFGTGDGGRMPHYLSHYLQARGLTGEEAAKHQVHPMATAWAQQLDPGVVAGILAKHGAPYSAIKAAIKRTALLQKRASSSMPMTFDNLFGNA